jgi:hypothetical protein
MAIFRFTVKGLIGLRFRAVFIGWERIRMIRFTEVVNDTNFNPRMERTAKVSFSIAEVWINEEYVVSIRPAPAYKKLLREGKIHGDLDRQHDFTTITTNNGALTEVHVVIGRIGDIALRLNKDRRELLKG